MSFHIRTKDPEQALATIRFFAETPENTSYVITSNLEMINRWGLLRKIFLGCCIDRYYLRHLHPDTSTMTFTGKLSVVIASDSYTACSPLSCTCAKAVEQFNRLIVQTNKELPPRKQFREEQLLVNFKKEEQEGLDSKKTHLREKEHSITAGPGKEVTTEEYNRLFGDVVKTNLVLEKSHPIAQGEKEKPPRIESSPPASSVTLPEISFPLPLEEKNVSSPQVNVEPAKPKLRPPSPDHPESTKPVSRRKKREVSSTFHMALRWKKPTTLVG